MLQDLYYHVRITAAGVSYDLSDDVTSMTIEGVSDRPDQLTIEVSDPYMAFGETFQGGMEVEVDLGRIDDHAVVFRGQIHKIDGNFPQDGVPGLRILAQDRSMKMGLRRRNRIWTGTTLTGIVEKIGADYFPQENIFVALREDPTFVGNGIRQQDETDLRFLRRLAARYGCEIFVLADQVADGLYFIAQSQIMQAKPVATLSHSLCDESSQLTSFEVSSDVRRIQLPRVFAGIDYASGAPTEVTKTDEEPAAEELDTPLTPGLVEFCKNQPSKAAQLKALREVTKKVQQQVQQELGKTDREVTAGFATAADLRARAQNQFRTSRHGMRASGSAAGNHRLRAHATVEILGVGDRFSGRWFLSQARHILDGQGYRIEIQCQR